MEHITENIFEWGGHRDVTAEQQAAAKKAIYDFAPIFRAQLQAGRNARKMENHSQ